MINEIKLGEHKPENIFSDIAENAAKKIKSSKDKNKTTQLRKFYDELVMWSDRIHEGKSKEEKEEKFNDLIPFIKMLKAKVAYAEARKHITNDFRQIFDCCIDQIKCVNTLRDAKLFMEAVMGYCKYEEIKGN